MARTDRGHAVITEASSGIGAAAPASTRPACPCPQMDPGGVVAASLAALGLGQAASGSNPGLCMIPPGGLPEVITAARPSDPGPRPARRPPHPSIARARGRPAAPDQLRSHGNGSYQVDAHDPVAGGRDSTAVVVLTIVLAWMLMTSAA